MRIGLKSFTIRLNIFNRDKKEFRMAQIQNNYIAGKWVAGVTSIENRNPSNHAEVIGEFAQASSKQVQ